MYIGKFVAAAFMRKGMKLFPSSLYVRLFSKFFCHLTFFKIIFFKNSFRVSNGLDPDLDRILSDLDPNCLQ